MKLYDVWSKVLHSQQKLQQVVEEMQTSINQVDIKLYQVGREIDSEKLYQAGGELPLLWSHGAITLRLSRNAILLMKQCF